MNHMNNSNFSDQMRYAPYQGGFDSQSYQDHLAHPSLTLLSGTNSKGQNDTSNLQRLQSF